MQPKPARLVPSSKPDPYDAAAVLLLLAIAILIPLTVRQYGISNDEDVQHRYGELIIAYYASGFADRSLLKFDNLYLYGGLFDLTAIFLAKLLSADVFLVRHVLCAFIGLGGIAATWATARLVAGPRAGLITAALLTVSGVWYGGMFNHTKDVPFAAAMIGGTWMLLRAARDLPRPRKRDTLLYGLMLGAALGIRVMGLLLGFYLLVALAVGAWAGAHGLRERLNYFARSFAAFLPALVLAYVIMIAAWPYAALGLFNPLRAVFAFADFHYNIRDLLAGQVYNMAEMPRWYLPAYVAIKLPLLMLFGTALALGFAATSRLAGRMRLEIALIAFTILFPVAAQVIGHGPIFSGMRHFIFIVPPLAVLAGIGCHILLERLQLWRRPAAVAAGIVVVAILLWNVSQLVRLHPHQYLAYNALVGGLPGANGRYATDYWSNTMPEAVRALQSFLAGSGSQERERYNVAICADQRQFEHVAGPRLRFTELWEEAHFFISPTHMRCDTMLEGRVIATVERMGVVLAVVKDRRDIIAPPK